MVLKCMKFTIKQVWFMIAMVLQWLKYIALIFAFTQYFTIVTYNLAYPIFFSTLFIYNLHSMFIKFMVLKVHMLGLLRHSCIVSFVFLHLLSSSHLLTSDISLLTSFSFIYCPFSLYQSLIYQLHMLSYGFIFIHFHYIL